MTTTTGRIRPPQRTASDVGNTSPTVAVVGKRNRIAMSLERVLQEHALNVIYHQTPDAAVKAASDYAVYSTQTCRTWVLEAKQGHSYRGWHADQSAQCAPVLYIFILPSAPRLQAHRKPKTRDTSKLIDPWLDAVRALGHGTPILIAADETKQRPIIEIAIESGAGEVIGKDEAKIESLVWRRVCSTLASAWYIPFCESVIASGEHSGEHDAVEPMSLHEAWAAPASDTETKAALARIHSQAESLPSRADRLRPLAELLGVVTPQLRSASGRLDAKQIAAYLDVSLRRVARAAGVSHQALSETPDSKSAQIGLDAVARALGVLEALLPEAQRRAWLHTPHSRLDGATPLDALLDGRADRVARMLEIAREGGVDG